MITVLCLCCCRSAFPFNHDTPGSFFSLQLVKPGINKWEQQNVILISEYVYCFSKTKTGTVYKLSCSDICNLTVVTDTGGKHELVPAEIHAEAEKYAKVSSAAFYLIARTMIFSGCKPTA